jgi:hypothetical protein
MVEFANLETDTTRIMKEAIIKGVEESLATGDAAAHVAAKILLPIINANRTGSAVDWAFTAPEVNRTLSRTRDGVRHGVLIFLRSFLSLLGEDRTITWRSEIGPLFQAVWPPDRTFRRAILTDEFVTLCVLTGDAFPEAFMTVKPFLVPFERDWVHVHQLASSDVPERFPSETLDLLWTVCGPPARRASLDLGPILDRIAKRSPNLVVDRRFQWLEERTYRRTY